MSEAPERIWAWPKGDWFCAGASTHPVKAAGSLDVEYIRADIHATALREAVEAARAEERERAARIAETAREALPSNCMCRHGMTQGNACSIATARNIAAAIRTPDTEQEG